LVGGEGDEKQVRLGATRDAERHLESAALRRRQQLHQLQHRNQELMQPREGKLRFGFDPQAAQPPETKAVRSSARIVQQRRFPDPGFTGHEQGRPSLSQTLEHRVDARCLDVAPDQLRSRQVNTPRRHRTSICA
jgi:hypothetical protein